jgi:putative FmdB family regulatory protein
MKGENLIMPFYDYCCSKCKNVIEREYPLGKAKTYVICPKCKKTANRKYSVNISIPNPTEARVGRGKG